jgi:hypothetical protein
VSFDDPAMLLLESPRASRIVDGTAVGAGRFWPAIWAFWERVEGRDCWVCWCWERRALALRRASSMRRTCSGVIAVVGGAGPRGGVVGRSVPAIVGGVLVDDGTGCRGSIQVACTDGRMEL